MNFKFFSHRYGLEIISGNDSAKQVFDIFCNALEEITEDELISLFQTRKKNGKKDKSLSYVINQLIYDKLKSLGWEDECFIFKDGELNASSSDWRLDFVYPDLFSVEIAFNHASAAAVNLLKPVLASELNHVEKAFQTKFGIIVTATREMKQMGGFDGAIGTFEGYCLQTKALSGQLTVPLVIVGLEAPESFYIKHEKVANRQIGNIIVRA